MDPSPGAPAQLIEPQAYVPSYDWHPAWPGEFRKMIFVIGVLIGLGLILAALWRSPWALAAVVAVSVVGMIGAGLWRSGLPRTAQATAAIQIRGESLTTMDRWFYQAGMVESASSLAVTTVPVRPVAYAAEQLSLSDLTLEVGPDGGPVRFTYRLPAGMRLAFVSREVSIGTPSSATPSGAKNSSLRELARRWYGPDAVVLSQRNESPWIESWPGD